MSTERRLQVTKRFTLEMAHALTCHDGPCKHMHGHSYVLDITLSGEPMDRPGDPKNGMVMDFADLKTIVKRCVVDHYDHALVLHESERSTIDLDHPLFGRTRFTSWQPTCENLLLDMVARIRAELPQVSSLSHARLRETATSWAEWEGGS